MSICLCILHLANASCRILRLLINYHSFLAFQFTLAKLTLPGNIMSRSWQYTAPVPSCYILVRLRFREVLIQFRRSVFGTKKAPYIIPMLCCSFDIFLL